MFSKLFLAMGLMLSVSANASSVNDILTTTQQMVMADANTLVEFKVGDMTSYKLKVAVINGTIKMTCTAVNGAEVTLRQEADLGFAGKQDCTIVMDTSTGETKSMVCNGQNQQPGEPAEYEVLEMKEDNVRVPAGTFVAVYIKARNKTKNEVIQQWASPRQIPLGGMVKAITPSQMGEVVLELTAFKKN
jgi:hypothetical protein